MLEYESRFAVPDEIVKAIEVRNDHRTAVRHCLERREPK